MTLRRVPKKLHPVAAAPTRPSPPTCFVSFASADRPWAEWIAYQLETAGLRVISQAGTPTDHADAVAFGPGANFVLAMHAALQRSDHTIALLSHHFFASAFTQPEWAFALYADPTGSRRRLIPVRVDDVQPAGLLSAIVYVDLVGVDERTARERLLEAVLPPHRLVDRLFARFRAPGGPVYPGASTASALAKPSKAASTEISAGNAALDRELFSASPDRDATLLIVDVDKMTEINTRHGVEVGNRVLEIIKTVSASALGEAVRLIRCGQDSFFAVLPVREERALRSANKLVRLVAACSWSDTVAPGLWVTVRAGVAQLHSGEHPNVATLRAMTALQAAGRAGGNVAMVGPAYRASVFESLRARAHSPETLERPSELKDRMGS